MLCQYPALNDVYTLSLATLQWTHLSPAGTPPAPRYGHSAVYDLRRDRMLVFGGPDNQTWALSLDPMTATWTQLLPDGTPPSARYGHGAIYDPVRDRMLVFAGEDSDDLWELSFASSASGTWRQLAPDGTTPPERENFATAYESTHDRMLVFGGTGEGGYSLGDTWGLELGRTPPRWAQLAPAGAPPAPRAQMIAAYDSAGRRMIISAGADGNRLFNDTWTLTIPESLSDAPDLQSIAPSAVARGSSVPITLTGANLDVQDRVWLSGSNHPPVFATTLSRISDIQLQATFDMASLPEETLTVVVEGPSGGRDSLVNALRIVVGPLVVIQHPNDGEHLSIGSSTAIAWHTTPGSTPVDHVLLELSTNGGQSFPTQIATAGGLDSIYLWTVSNVTTDSARVRATAFDRDGFSGSDTSDRNFGIGPEPDLRSISPTRVAQGTSVTLTLTGASFTYDASVWLSVPAYGPVYPISTTVINSETIVVTVSLGGVPTGAATVIVRNRGGGLDSLAGALQIVAPPAVTVLAPNGGERFDGGAPITIRWRAERGSSDIDHFTVLFASDGVTYAAIGVANASDSAFAWNAPYVPTTDARVQVIAFDVEGFTGNDRSDGTFTIVVAPGLSAVSPTTLVTGGPDTLTLYGGSFSPNATVWLSGANMPLIFATSVQIISSTELSARFDLVSASSGVRTVVLQNSGATADSLVDAVRLVAPPRVGVVFPNGGETFPPGTPVTARWSVMLGDNPLSLFTVFLSVDGGVSYTQVASAGPTDTSVTWSTPPTTNYYCRVRVVARDTAGVAGSDDSNGNFSIASSLDAPVISAVSPTKGSVGDSLGAGLSGSRFSALNVWIESGTVRRYATSVQLVSADSIHCGLSLKNLAPGVYDVVEENRDGQIARLAQGFTVYARPDLQWIDPEVVGVGGPASVTLYGTNFSAGGTAWLSARNKSPVYASTLTFVSDTELRATFPLEGVPTGTRTVVVQSSAGARDSLVGALVLVTPPHVTTLAPNGGETFSAGTVTSVRLTTTRGTTDLEHIDVLLSTDSGTSYATFIAQGLSPDATSVDWTVPPVVSATARVRVVAYDLDGVQGWDDSDADFRIEGNTGADSAPQRPPRVFALGAVAPHPSRGIARLALTLPERTAVNADIFDLQGHHIAEIYRGELPAGMHTLLWSGHTNDGTRSPTGVYVCRVTAGSRHAERRVLWLR
jgi:hypothetical protein